MATDSLGSAASKAIDKMVQGFEEAKDGPEMCGETAPSFDGGPSGPNLDGGSDLSL